jgi:hypothetical protein
MERSFEHCIKQVRPLSSAGQVDMIEVNHLAALTGTTWQEALDFVKGLARRVRAK